MRGIERVIRWSLESPVIVLFAAALLGALGLWALERTPVDALPDLSDVQVIVRTNFPGQSAQVVEDQVTFPLSAALLGAPGAASVRGYSFFGDSFIHVLFKDGTDPYWARARVTEYLSRAAARLPRTARVEVGPDATGVGWIYEYALLDRSGRHDLAELRSLQDWYLKYDLQSVEGVSEVATIGGMVKQYQVMLDPVRMRAHAVTLQGIRAAIEDGNRETGGSVIEMAETEYMVRATGYVRGVDDLRRISLGVGDGGVPLLLGDVADIRVGPEMRRGLADLDGEGEVVGGVIIMREGQNAQSTIAAVRSRLTNLRKGLPAGVEIVETYNRAVFVHRAIENLAYTLIQEFLVVLAVCVIFLLHVRSAAALFVALPLGILVSFLIMRVQGINANVMSLCGIAIAIGAMVDAAIVMIENVHKKLDGSMLSGRERVEVVAKACSEVGPSLFISLLIVALSFVPILSLEAEEGRLFAPLAYTKTYAILAAALVSITVVPIVIWLSVRGTLRSERDNPVNRLTSAMYEPLLKLTLDYPRSVVGASLALVLITLLPASHLGSEFMPSMDEGDLLYMPTTSPGISVDAARALLQQTDRMIREVPEVEHVFGKAGRAETATDPAPIEMFETIVKLKPHSQWRAGLTLDQLKAELDARVRLPGLTNSWLAPIRSRIDMLQTGVRTPIGVKISGPDTAVLQRTAQEIAGILQGIPGATSVYAERSASGRYIEIDVDRLSAARYGISMSDIHDLIGLAVGGATISESVEGRERYPIILRYPPEWRDSIPALRALPLITSRGTQITLGDVAAVRVAEGASVIRSENARPVAWILVNVSGRDLGAFVAQAKSMIDSAQRLPTGYQLSWSGEYESLARATARLELAVGFTLSIIIFLLYVNFGGMRDVLLVLSSLPVALAGGVWIVWALKLSMSVAVAVGFIALAGVAAETGIVMLLYLNQAWAARRAGNAQAGRRDLRSAIVEGALLRLRPKLMTVLTVLASLLPIMFSDGAGSEVMRRIAAPLIGGMVSSTLITLLALPALYLLLHDRRLTEDPDSRA